jgi:hypothetical protein
MDAEGGAGTLIIRGKRGVEFVCVIQPGTATEIILQKY